MSNRTTWLTGAALLLGLCAGEARPAAPSTSRDRAVAGLAERIDHHVEAALKRRGVRPGGAADDAAFLRRVTLDLTGAIPTLTQVRDFLDDDDPGKRAALVRRLLRGEAYARHSAALYVLEVIPPGKMGRESGSQLRTWVQRQIKAGAGHDRIARALIAGEGEGARVFDQAAESRPEELASLTTRAFLGVKLECAQCHDHPFAPWKKKQFWELAAFFANVRSQVGGPPPGDDAGRFRREIAIPNTKKVAKARFTDGTAPDWGDDDEDPRRVLAAWVARRDNPAFARATVNRIWARFFGVGLVEPVDEMEKANPASHPALLDELAQAFARGGFDERFLVEAILRSRTYGRSSDPVTGDDARLYARAAVRSLTPEQLFDSYTIATGGEPYPETPARAAARRGFLDRFPLPERPGYGSLSLLQALYLMNGPATTVAGGKHKNPILEVLEPRAATHTGRSIDELFLTVLSRYPHSDERLPLVKYVQSGGPTKSPRRALADVYWALLNSAEFLSNH